VRNGKTDWIVIILAVSFLGCSNPAGDTAAVGGSPTWETLRVKFKVSSVVIMRGNSKNDNMISME